MAQNIFVKDLASSENLYWAWEKVKRQYESESSWCNQLDIAEFESNLGANLRDVGSQFLQGNYRPGLLRPLGQPKKKRGSDDGELELRQMFWLPVRDQVAWVALVNLIGPALDSQMPQWSFGNRLHRSAWIEESSNEDRQLKIGPYRRSSSNLYRKFSQSWPLYKRYVYLTLRAMVSERNQKYFELERAENEILRLDEKSPENLRCPYLVREYWSKSKKSVYWASIDFEKFYPNLKTQHILDGFSRFSPHAEDEQISSIFNSLLQFKIDKSSCSEVELAAIGLTSFEQHFSGLPTGLLVAGFLANVAMLVIDKKVLSSSRANQIAHFRYVDDHTILGESLDSVVAWINKYRKFLIEECNLASLNPQKVEPEELAPLLDPRHLMDAEKVEITRDANKASKIDLQYPRPFLTKTLSKVSQLARLEFELLDEREQAATISDLELLLLADIGDSELPHTTRLSFAATLISKFSAQLEVDQDNVAIWGREIAALQKTKSIESRKRIGDLEALIRQSLDKGQSDLDAKLARSFGLLQKVIHENPDKLRLWERALDFCLNTGYAGIGSLFHEISQIGKKNPLVQNYLDAFLVGRIASRVLRGIREIDLAEDAVSQRRIRAWLMFVADAATQSARFKVRLSAAPIGQAPCNLLGCALSVAKLFVVTHDLFKEDWVNAKVLNQIAGNNSLDFLENTDQSEVGLFIWLWWIDSQIADARKFEPPSIWSLLIQSIDLSKRESWLVLEKYPSALPKNAVSHLLSNKVEIGEEQEGWLIEALHGAELSKKALKAAAGHNEYFDRALVILESRDIKVVTLFEWLEWAAKQTLTDRWDSRVGEWTMLEIIRQVFEKILGIDAQSEDISYALHPLNILVPRQWMALLSEADGERGAVLGWEAWKRTSREFTVSLRDAGTRVRDGRYFPVNKNDLYPEMGPIQVRAAGLLLFGLLRKSFSLPGSLNLSRFPSMWDRVMRSLIGDIACSSWSTAILESCLLSRSRENQLLGLSQGLYQWDSDIQFDPPPINSLFEMSEFIDKAQGVLERHQLSIRDYQPRQLTPMLVEQMPKFSQLDND